MLAKAVQEHCPVGSGFKGSTLSQKYNATATDKPNALKPRPSSTLNRSSPTSLNPLKRAASSQEQGLKKALMNSTQPSLGGGRLNMLHDPVLFDENDFENDEDIDLDAVDSPIPALSSTLLPDLPQKKSTPPQTPVSSTPLPWSSSPPSNHHMPPPKPLTQTVVTDNTVKRRTLPWIEDAKKADQARREKSDRLCEALTGGNPPTPSEEARIDRKKVRKVLNRQCEDLTEGVQHLNGDHQSTTPDLERYRANTIRNGAPGWVADKAVQGKKRKIDTAYTPLPKNKTNSPYPWNTTASAVKEEQKRLRQGQKKLSKDIEGGPEKANLKKKGRDAVPKVFLSDEQMSVLELVAEQKKSVFFTGSAGTGKSVLLREIIKALRNKYIKELDRVAVTASTGLAACNVGGVTLHSFAGIGLGKEAAPELVKKIKRNQKAKNRWLRTKVLIVDEISMVDGDLFDKLEAIARAIRNNGRPFGGIQLIITGDFFQLPPVPDYGRVSKFSFDATTWNTSIEHTIGLTQVFRQKDPGAFFGLFSKKTVDRFSFCEHVERDETGKVDAEVDWRFSGSQQTAKLHRRF